MSQIDLPGLRILLDERLDLSELRSLCFAMEVDYDNLIGENKINRIENLITTMNHRNRLNELIDTLRAERPDLNEALDELFVEDEIHPPITAEKEILETYKREVNKISQSLKRNGLVLFLGADLPEAVTGMPNRAMLATALAREEEVEPQDSWAKVAQLVMQYGNRFTFTQFLQKQLNITGKQPQPFHKCIAELVQKNNIDTIVTTAYDSLLETYFRESNVPLAVVVNDTGLSFADPNQPTLLKLYGDWERPESLIVTDQDQNALLNGRNQDKSEMMGQIKFSLRRQAVLFVGYDLKDTAVNTLFDSVNAQKFQQPAFALWSGLSEREKENWQGNRGLTIIDADPVTFLSGLLKWNQG